MPVMLLVLLQDDEGPVPFGQFMEAVPHWAFIVIHSTLILMSFVLARRARGAGYGTAANGFLLFCLAELSYITYHLHATHFLLAHTIAEVLDALAFLTIGVGLVRRTK
jgi:hypothetical protein